MQNFNDSAVVTKIKAMYSRRINKNQLTELSNCKSVELVASYLKNNTNYKDVLKNIDESTIHRGQLENLLKKQNFDNYDKIYKYLNKKNNTIFEIIIEEFEIVEILRFMLLLKADVPNKYITSLPGHLISRCKINLLKLAGIKNYEDLLEFFKKTHYYKVLNNLKPSGQHSEIDYVSCEYELYIHFYKRIFENIEKNFKHAEMIELKKLVELQIDYLNICSIYREKFLFNSNYDKIKKRIFPFHRILSNDKINVLIDTKNIDEFGTKLKEFFHTNDNLQRILENKNYYIEHYVTKLKYQNYKHFLYLSNNISTVFYTFHRLSQIEISNLIYVIEGVRYNIAAKEIQSLQII